MNERVNEVIVSGAHAREDKQARLGLGDGNNIHDNKQLIGQ